MQTSCGYAVPLMEFAAPRDTLRGWAERKGPDGVAAYWAENERAPRSTAGRPASRPALAGPRVTDDARTPSPRSRPSPTRRRPRRWPPTTRRRGAISGSPCRRSRRWSPSGAPGSTCAGRVRPRRRALGQRRPRGADRRGEAADPGAHPRRTSRWSGTSSCAGSRASTPGRSPTTPARRRAAAGRPGPTGSTRSRAGCATPNMWVRRAALVATLPWTKLEPPHAGRERGARAHPRLGRRRWSRTGTGSSRRPSAGGCAACRSTTPTARAPSSTAPGAGLKPFARKRRGPPTRLTCRSRWPALDSDT